MRRTSWIPPVAGRDGRDGRRARRPPGRTISRPVSCRTGSRYNNAGWRSLNQGQYDKAEEQFRLAIEEIRPYQKKDQRLLARSYADLARVFYHQGRYADAEPLAKWALSVRESHPKTNPDAVFQNLYTLALIHIAQAHFDQAEPLLRRALELQEKAIGPNHVQTAATLDELAGVCAQQRKYKDAERLYQRAIAIYERFDPDENLDLAGCAERYAAMLKQLDRAVDAEKLAGPGRGDPGDRGEEDERDGPAEHPARVSRGSSEPSCRRVGLRLGRARRDHGLPGVEDRRPDVARRGRCWSL